MAELLLSKDAERQMRLIQKIGEVAAAVGWQANVGAMELAGQLATGQSTRPLSCVSCEETQPNDAEASI